MSGIHQDSQFIKNYKIFARRLNNLYWKRYWNWHLEFKKFADEDFKEIEGYHGFYFISNYGQVVSFYFKHPFVRKYNFISGLFSMNLTKYGISHSHSIHDLVYSTFIGPIKPGRRVIHINGITTDNFFKNLKSVKLSSSKKRITGKLFDFSLYNRIEEESTRIARNTVAVLQFDRKGIFIKEYSSIKSAAIISKLSPDILGDCLRGDLKTAGGYQWRYKRDEIFRRGICNIEPVKYDPNFKISPVLQFDLLGNFICEYPTITKAGKNIKTSNSAISLCASGKYKSAGGYQWRYKDDPIFANGICHIDPVKPTIHPSRRAIYQFDIQGNFIKEYPSISAASQALKISNGNISTCIKGKTKSSGGFQWRYKTDPLFKNGSIKIIPLTYPFYHKTEPVLQFDQEGKFLKEFNSVTEAAKSVGIIPSSVYSCIRGKVKTAAGFQWCYKRSIKVLDDGPSIGPIKDLRNKYGPILQFSSKGKFIREYSSVSQAAKNIGVHPNSIRRCLLEESKTCMCMGFQWLEKSDPIFKNGVKNISSVRQYPKSSTPRPVFQFKMNGKLIREYISINEASRILGISRKMISSCALNKTRSAAGYRWKFRNDPLFKKGFGDIPALKIIDPSIKPVLQFDLRGNFIQEYRSIINAACQLGISKNSIRDCLRGINRTAGKFQWKYKNDPLFEKGIVDICYVTKIDQYNYTPVLQFDLEGKFIREYSNIKEAVKTLGIRIENIRDCFKGRSKTAAGFQWRSINDPFFRDGIVDIEPVKRKNKLTLNKGKAIK